MTKDEGSEAYSHISIVGDFNYKNINWSNHSAPRTASDLETPESLFLDSINDCFLTQHVTQHTRARGTDEPSLLDLVITNDPGMIDTISHHAPLGKSDHASLIFDIHCYAAYDKPQTRFSYNKGDYMGANEFLNSCIWDGDNPESMWENYQENLQRCRDTFIPTYQTKPMAVETSSVNKAPLDKATRDLILKKRGAFNLSVEHSNKPDAEEYRSSYNKIRNKVTTKLRQKKRNQEKEIVDSAKTNPKKFWAYCQSKTRTRSGVAPLLRDKLDPDSLVSADEEKAEVLQTQFCSVFTLEGDDDLPNFERRCEEDISPITIDINKVKKKLKELKPNKSAGPDGLSPRLLKECADSLAEPVTKLFQHCVDSGTIPSAWRESIVSPIFKKGARNLAENYRPVSLTAVLCKLLDNFVREAIIEHLMKHSLLSKRQFGFLKGRSTGLQLLTFLDSVSSKLHTGGQVDTVYLDYQKAFDTVPHHRLLLN